MNKIQMTDRSAIIFVCRECDALQQVFQLSPGYEATCIRCHNRLFRNPKGGIDYPLALVISALILFIVSNIYPILTLSIMGINRNSSISHAAFIFIQTGNPVVGGVVWLSSVLIPGLLISGLLYILLDIRFQLGLPFTTLILKYLTYLIPWGMMDVFFLGILVALVKLVALADIVLNLGFYSFLFLVLIYASILTSIDMHTLWESLNKESNILPELKHV